MSHSPADLRLIGPCQTLDGEPSSSLSAVNTTILSDGAICYVIEDKGIWFLDKLSTLTPNGYNVLMSSVGPGRWVRVGGLPSSP